MNVRHFTEKSFEQLTRATTQLIDNNSWSIFKSIETLKSNGQVNRAKITARSTAQLVSNELAESMVKQGIPIMAEGGEIKSLAKCLLDGLDSEAFEKSTEIARFRFRNDNLERIDPRNTYTKYIPLMVGTNTIPVQLTKAGSVSFNPLGSVTVAEFLDGLSAIVHGANYKNEESKSSLDNISNNEDYFHEGYLECIDDKYSSPFFNLYTREGLMQPITRLEAAYIIVLCWSRFRELYKSPITSSEDYDLGIGFDWKRPKNVLDKYADGSTYKVSKVILDVDADICSLDIRSYKQDLTVKEYISAIRTGERAIAMPLFMSLLELGEVNIFPFEDGKLHPVYELTRGEWAYLLANLTNLLLTKEALN